MKQACLDLALMRRMVNEFRVLQEIAARGDRPITYGVCVEKLQPQSRATGNWPGLEDFEVFRDNASRPNVTCFVVSAATGRVLGGIHQDLQ